MENSIFHIRGSDRQQEMGTREPKFGHPLDGFFAALVAGPETLMLSKDYPEVFGSHFGAPTKPTIIAGTLFKGESYVPLLLENENGMAPGNNWVSRLQAWQADAPMAELVKDEEHGGWLIPMISATSTTKTRGWTSVRLWQNAICASRRPGSRA